MDDFHGEVRGALGQVGQQVKSTLFNEVKKIGRGAASSIVGKTPPSHTRHSSGLGAAGSAPTSKVAEEHHHVNRFAGMGPLAEILKIGQTAGSQISGKPLTAREITEMAQKDNYQSKMDADAVREKILRIYREHNEKRKKEEKEKEWGYHLLESQNKKKEEGEKKPFRPKVSLNPNMPQVAKTRPEIGRNYGSGE